MSWGSVELENYDTAYCTTCQRPVFRRFDDKSWRHNGYHKDNGSHTIEPYDIALSNKTQRRILEEQNMTEEAPTPLCGNRGVSMRHRTNNEEGGWGDWTPWSPSVATFELEYEDPYGNFHQYEFCTPHSHGFKYEPKETDMADDTTTAVSPVNEGCAVLHQDEDGNPIPCPGYPHASESPAEPLPQPECTSCHGFGAGIVQDAVQELKERVEKHGFGNLTPVSVSTLSIVLAALEHHHNPEK